MPSSSPLRHDLSPSLLNPTKRGRTLPRLPEPTLTAMSTAATLPRRDSPATDCLPLTPHGLVCKTPVTTHACLLGSACTARPDAVCCCQRRKGHESGVHNTCPRARACRTSAPTLQTTTSTRPDPRPQAAETTSPAAARYLHPLAGTGRQQESVPTAAAAADKPPPRRALNRIEQPASGRSPFQASATACPPRAGASPAKAANSSIPFSRIQGNGDEAEIEAGSDEDVPGGADPIVRAATTRSHSSRAKA